MKLKRSKCLDLIMKGATVPANTFAKKGMRVIVKVTSKRTAHVLKRTGIYFQPGAYIGTIILVGTKFLTVKLDNGTTFKYPKRSPNLLGKAVKRQRKGAIPLAKVSKWTLSS